MPIVTYFAECEILAFSKSSNPVITDLLSEANSKSPARWLVRDYPVTSTKSIGFLFKRKVKAMEMYHELYVATVEPEFQIINFYQEGAESTINTIVSSDVIVSYLMGFLAAAKRHLNTKQSASSYQPNRNIQPPPYQTVTEGYNPTLG
jgi:hypothetical protein